MSTGTLFFDYDGTLHNSMKLYGPAFRKGYSWLVEQGVASPQEFSEEEISQWLGWAVEDMWNTFLPELEEKTWKYAASLIGREMDALLEAGEGALFEGVKDTLITLYEQGYELAFLSNCGRPYCNKHLKTFGIDRLFSATYPASEFNFAPKWEIYTQVASNHPYPHIVIGDRFHDIEVGTKAGIPSIGCAYGYGKPEELEAATLVVNRPSEIPTAVNNLVNS